MNIFVACLNPATTPRDLQRLFAHYGLVKSVKVIMDHFTGRSKGYGFVEMPDNNDANEAVLELNNSLFMDQIITVKDSRPAGYAIPDSRKVNINSTAPSLTIGNITYYRNSTSSIKAVERETILSKNAGSRKGASRR